MDEMLYQDGYPGGRLTLPRTKGSAPTSTPAARAANKDPDFSVRIRAGRPGFSTQTSKRLSVVAVLGRFRW